MSKAKAVFDYSIKDAESLLALFDTVHKQSSPENAEVLKRAGLILALTAWETYVEDRVREEMRQRLRVVEGSYVGKYIEGKLEEELKRFHTPNSAQTRRIFLDFLDVDVTVGWMWQHFDMAKAKNQLDSLIAKRGDVVHRSKPLSTGTPAPHAVRRDDLEKSIKFLKELVEATDRTLAEL
ncbi:MAG: HEPN domain-containing protein [Capsulimonadales bacterium]|nr:HEPN domain-containing protein [Capsulimonadales bacterium]